MCRSVMAGRQIRYRLGKILRFKEKYLRMLLYEGKKTTIRRGIVTPGSQTVYLESGGKIYGEATISGVKYTRLSELTRSDAVSDGFGSREELLRALKEIYPDLRGDDWVTIIEFGDVTRYSEPVPRDALREARGYSRELPYIARLALAYGVAENVEEQRVLAKMRVHGDVRKTARELGLSPGYVKLLLGRVARKLKERGLL